jgi:tRNAThr (cytosine32-N3)-methyltransferase
MDDVEARARAAIDALHAADPERVAGRPAEADYADRIEAWIARLVTDGAPSPALRLAARAQHLERWAIPRSQFPEGRGGYLRWRSAVHQRQGERARALVTEAGGDTALAERTARLVAKAAAKDDPEAQALEDAACLVFLETDLLDFQRDHDRDKVVDVLRKTWKKMGPRGRELAMALDRPADSMSLVRAALA